MCIFWLVLRTQWPRKLRRPAELGGCWQPFGWPSRLQLHSRRDPLRPGAPSPPLPSWQFCCALPKYLSVSQGGSFCDFKCQNFWRWIHFLCCWFPCAQECPGMCLKVKPPAASHSFLSPEMHNCFVMMLDALLCPFFFADVLPVVCGSGSRKVFFSKVEFCSNIGVTGRPSLLQLNCALA